MATKRRGHGGGSVYRDGDKWRAQVSLGEGKRKSSPRFDTQKEAQEWDAKTRADLARGMVMAAGGITVKHYLTDWLEWIRPNVRESTWVRYEQLVRVHLVPGLGKWKLDALSPHAVQQFYSDKRRATDLSPTTIRRMHDVLHNALDDALRKDMVRRNVTELVDAPREAERAKRYYTVEQVAQLMAVLDGHPLEHLVLVALNTGMREGELVALQWRDVDLACGAVEVRVNRTLTIEGTYTDGPPKTRGSHGRLRLSPTALDALRRQQTRVKLLRLRAGDAWQDRDLVFPTRRGTHYLPQNIRRAWITLTKRAGLPYVRFHDLRHSAGTLLAESGVDIQRVSAALRHDRIETTSQFYAFVTPAMEEETAQAMERIMQRARAIKEGRSGGLADGADGVQGATGTANGLPNLD